MDLTIFLFFHTVMVERMRIQHDIWRFRDTGTPFETHNSLTRSWVHLSYPISPVVWFRYYRELEDFVRTTEGQSPLYIRSTVFMPFDVIAYDHVRMEVYRMFYFNTPYRLYFFITRLRFRLLFVSSTACGDQITIERLMVTSTVSDTLYHGGMMCEL